jgi:hypothetical protein
MILVFPVIGFLPVGSNCHARGSFSTARSRADRDLGLDWISSSEAVMAWRVINLRLAR